MSVVRFDQIARECRETFKGSFEGKPIVGLEHIEPYDMLLKNYDVDVETTFTKSFKKGQILFGRRRAYQHKACVATIDGICSGDITVIEPIEGKVYPDLLPFIIQNDDFFEHAIKGSNGALSPRVKWEHMASFEFDLPSLAEQKVLAEKLWAAYEVKQSYLKMIAATEEMVKAQFIEMFGDPVSWQTDSSLPSLNDTVNVISGFPFDSEEFNAEGVGTPLIRIRDIQRGYSETFTTEAFDKQYRIKKGELLIGMDGMFDIARWQSDEAALNQRVCCLRMKGSENDTFIQYLVQPILKHIENGTNATTVKHISTKQINCIRVPNASHEQKTKFAMIANQADKSGFELRKSVDAIDKVIKSLINENL